MSDLKNRQDNKHTCLFNKKIPCLKKQFKKEHKILSFKTNGEIYFNILSMII